jgi:hypothetical protein
MMMLVPYIAPADEDASLAGDGPWAATMIVFGDVLTAGPASTKQHCPART